MPSKRKADELGTDANMLAQSKKAKVRAKPSSHETADGNMNNISAPSKSTKSQRHFANKAASQRVPEPPSSPPSKNNHVPSISNLIPHGERQKATVGQKDESMLRILCNDIKTSAIKELHFRHIPHSSVDWDNPNHIAKINSWRNQIYGRAGMKAKTVSTWLEDEELWFELYYHHSIAEALVRGMLLPKSALVLDAFNETFVGRRLEDHRSDELAEPRGPRSLSAFSSKFNRVCLRLRGRLQQCVFGKSGDVFVPKIMFDMVQGFKRMKTAMAEKNVLRESDYSGGLAEWRYLFSHLPRNGTRSLTQSGLDVTQEQDEAAATLLSLAGKPVKSAAHLKIEDDSIIRSFNHPYSEDVGVPSCRCPSLISPGREVDIHSLIASPD